VAAALSQFSAAVADTLAAAGNMQETTHGHLKAKWGCILVGGGAIALTWSSRTLEIVALASRSPRASSPSSRYPRADYRPTVPLSVSTRGMLPVPEGPRPPVHRIHSWSDLPAAKITKCDLG
jgi:hypothetical protein